MANFTFIKIWMAAKGTIFELTLGILTEFSFHWDVYSVTFFCVTFSLPWHCLNLPMCITACIEAEK